MSKTAKRISRLLDEAALLLGECRQLQREAWDELDMLEKREAL